MVWKGWWRDCLKQTWLLQACKLLSLLALQILSQLLESLLQNQEKTHADNDDIPSPSATELQPPRELEAGKSDITESITSRGHLAASDIVLLGRPRIYDPYN